MISAASVSRLARTFRQGLALALANKPRHSGRDRLARSHDFRIVLNHPDPDITPTELLCALEDAHRRQSGASMRRSSVLEPETLVERVIPSLRHS